MLVYDLTSTYVEGAAEKNPMVRRGYSRDHGVFDRGIVSEESLAPMMER